MDVRWTKRKEGVNIQICTSYASFVWNIWSSGGRIFGDDDPVCYLLLRLGPSLPLHPSHVHLTTFTWWISTGFPHFCHPFVPVYTKCELKREASEQGHPLIPWRKLFMCRGHYFGLRADCQWHSCCITLMRTISVCKQWSPIAVQTWIWLYTVVWCDSMTVFTSEDRHVYTLSLSS